MPPEPSGSGGTLSQIDGRIHAVDIALIQLPTQQIDGLTEPLEVYDLPLPKELDDVIDVRIIAESENVVIGCTGLLLRSQVLGQVCDGVALDGDTGGGPGEAGGGGGVDTCCMVHEIGRKGGVLDLGVGQLPGELVDDSPNHFQVPEFLSTWIGVGMTPE